jgi:hypothetical protein
MLINKLLQAKLGRKPKAKRIVLKHFKRLNLLYVGDYVSIGEEINSFITDVVTYIKTYSKNHDKRMYVAMRMTELLIELNTSVGNSSIPIYTNYKGINNSVTLILKKVERNL